MANPDFLARPDACPGDLYLGDGDEIIKNMNMIPAHSIEEAIAKVKELLGKSDVKIVPFLTGCQ